MAGKLRPNEPQYNYLVYRASLDGHVCELTYEDYINMVGSPCSYCGGVINWENYSKKEYNYTKAYFIDRKNNDLGYTVDNSVACCPTCNRCKSKMSHIEFINLCNKIANGPLAKELK